MIGYIITLDVDARRSRDTYELAEEIEVDFRASTVGDRDLDFIRSVPGKRGGKIVLRATIGEENNEAVMARLRTIAASIDQNRNRIDRVDEFRVSAIYADVTGIVGFCSGDFRGWVREIALEELDAAPPTR